MEKDWHGLQTGDELEKKNMLNFSKRASRDVIPVTASYCLLFLLILMLKRKLTLHPLIFS